MTILHEEDKSVAWDSKGREVGCICGWRYSIPNKDAKYWSGTAKCVMMDFHLQNPEKNIDERELAHMPYPGMTPIVMTCKECDWIEFTDKVSEVSHIVSSHRVLHEITYYALRDKVAMEREKAKNLEEKIESVKASIDFLSDADKTIETLRNKMVALTEELESLRS